MNPRWCASLLAILILAALATVLVPARSVPAEDGNPLSLDNEPVCRVNTDMISKRDVEDRMQPPGVAAMLRGKKLEWEHARMWNDENQKAWYEAYIPPFRDALRQIVRERLILQAAKTEKITADEKEYDKEYEGQIKRLRELNLLGSKGYTPAEVAKAVREN